MIIHQLLGDRIAVTPDQRQVETKSGLLLTEAAKEKPCTGTVKSVGTETNTGKPLPLRQGDKVLYYRHAGIEIEVDGEKIMVFREPEIIAIIG